MKFHQLETGQRYIFAGQLYIKVSPVVGRHAETGEQKFMRRADGVQLPGDESLSTPATGVRKHIEVKKVMHLFDDFYQQLSATLERELAALSAEDKAQVAAQVQQLGQGFKNAVAGTKTAT